MTAKFKLSELADDLAVLAEYEQQSPEELDLRRQIIEAKTQRIVIAEASKQHERDAAEAIKVIQNRLWAQQAEAQAATGKLNETIRTLQASLDSLPPKTDAVDLAKQIAERYGMPLSELRDLCE